MEAVVLTAAALLLVGGLGKVADPGPVTGTLVELWIRATGGSRPVGSTLPGRALGVGEVGLAVLVVARMWAAASCPVLVSVATTKLAPLARDRRRSADGFDGRAGGLAW